MSSHHRRLAGTGWRHRQVDNPELNHQQGTASIFHTLCPIKAFLCPEYLQTDVSNTPELCRLFWLCSWSEQAPPQQLKTTGSSQEPVKGQDAAAAQHSWKTPSPPTAHPASCEVPPQGSLWMAAAGQGAQEEHTEAGATTLKGHGLGPGAQDLLEHTNQPCSVTPIL